VRELRAIELSSPERSPAQIGLAQVNSAQIAAIQPERAGAGNDAL
jgi:hypothetical protein